MSKNAVSFFKYSTGVLFLAAATAVWITISTTATLFLPRDPVFLLPMRMFLLIVGGICLCPGIINIFFETTFQRSIWSTLAANILVIYFLACVWMRGHNLTGYLWGATDCFGLSPKTANLIVEAILGYLLLGSYAVTVSFCSRHVHNLTEKFIKMSCASCGGNIEFSVANLEMEVPCPHCSIILKLRSPKA